LFAKKRFNPFKPFPIHELRMFDIGTAVERSTMTWTVFVDGSQKWKRANQFVRFDVQPISIIPWGVQIYTDNTDPAASPRFVDPSPANTSNIDSNPAGLLRKITGQTTSHYTLDMAWCIKEATATVPVANSPSDGSVASFQWIPMKDRATPAIPGLNTTAFADGQDDVAVRKPAGYHLSQGPAGFFPLFGPANIYFEANFAVAAAQTPYQTSTMTIEFYLQ
jgi:hypothetical protein